MSVFAGPTEVKWTLSTSTWNVSEQTGNYATGNYKKPPTQKKSYDYSNVTFITKNWVSEEQQSLVQYAWSISNSVDFVLTLEAESGFRRDAVGDWWHSYWICQRYNPSKRNRWQESTDPALENGYTMIQKCRESWQIKGKQIWSWLHWYHVRHRVAERFTMN